MTDYNNFGEKEKVFINDFKVDKIKKGTLQVEIPAHSVILLELK